MFQKEETKLLPLMIQMFAEDLQEKEEVDDDKTKESDSSNKNQESEKKYTDDEVNKISKKNEDKAIKKLMKDLGIDDIESAKNILSTARAEKEKNKTAEDKSQELSKTLLEKDKMLSQKNEKLVNALLESRLMREGVESSKIDRAKKMISSSSVLGDDGEVDDELISSEIEKLLNDFPEFKAKSNDDTKPKGFKFGSDNSDDKGKSKPVDPSQMKRWNRFK